MTKSAARARKSGKKGKRREKDPGPGPLELVLAPVAALAVIVLASARALLDRRSPVTPGGGQSGPAGAPPSSTSKGDGEKEPAGGIKGRLEAVGRRFPFFGRILDVQERYGEVRGNNIAAAVTLQSFLSLFPLILVAVAVIGFLSASDTGDVAQSIIRSLGLDGDAAQAVTDAVSTAEESRRAASVVGLAGLLWSGLGLVNALQFAFNQVWQVEERGVKDKAVGVAWLAGAGLLLLAGSVLTTVLRWLPDLLSPVGILLAAAINTALWLWTAKVLPNRKVGWR
ncbi:MAG: YihY/virulence factor BrkB family protein, partial [Actinobacteria bacterium]|nr:YihY/virulence factor BrkB family protein [Actinomycetota bacterium]